MWARALDQGELEDALDQWRSEGFAVPSDAMTLRR